MMDIESSQNLDETMWSWLKRVQFTGSHCGACQRIPLRRIHFFERFHELEASQPVLIRCPECRHGLQIPGSYRTHTGHLVEINSRAPPKNAVIHDAYF